MVYLMHVALLSQNQYTSATGLFCSYPKSADSNVQNFVNIFSFWQKGTKIHAVVSESEISTGSICGFWATLMPMVKGGHRIHCIIDASD